MKVFLIVPKCANPKQTYREYPLGVGLIATALQRESPFDRTVLVANTDDFKYYFAFEKEYRRYQWEQYGAGPFGTLDQAGNVWEWMEDEYDPYAYRHATTPATCASSSTRRSASGSACDSSMRSWCRR